MRHKVVVVLNVVVLVGPLVWFFVVFGPSLKASDWLGLALVCVVALLIGVISILPLVMEWLRVRR